MASMATWRDGAEYAPTQRPDGFATPRVDPLDDPGPVVHISGGAPAQLPASFQTPQGPQPPLQNLVPRTDIPRDPREPFHVDRSLVSAGHSWTPDQPITSGSSGISSSMGGSSAWGAAHATRPSPDPVLASFPPPQAAGRIPVEDYDDAEPDDRPGLGQVLAWASPAALVCFALGAIGVPSWINLPWLMPLLFVTGAALTTQAKVARRVIGLVGNLATLIVMGAMLYSLVSTQDIFTSFDTLQRLSWLGCLVMPMFMVLVVALAVRRGERPIG